MTVRLLSRLGWSVIVIIFIVGIGRCCLSGYLPSRGEYETGIRFLRQNRLALYAAYNGFHEFDVDSGNWELVLPDVRGNLPGEVAVHDDCVFFYDPQDGAIRKYNLTTERTEDVIHIGFRPGRIAVSPDKVAYSDGAELFVWGNGELVHRTMPDTIFSMDWHANGQSLFLSVGGVIRRLDLVTMAEKEFAEGIWVCSIPEHIVFCNRARNAIYKINLASGEESLVYKPEGIIEGMDPDPTGKFMVFAVRTNRGWLRHWICPVIWDSETMKVYKYPQFVRTGLIFLE